MSILKPISHDSGMLHVTGRACYTDDIALPSNTLHLAFVLSDHASAQIEDIDISKAMTCKGVVAVYMADDIMGVNDVSPVAHDEPLLAVGRVHYVGQPIAIVVAHSHHLARRAARCVQVTYVNIAKPVLDIDQALAMDNPFEIAKTYEKGTPEDALAKADHTIEGSFDIGPQEHFYLEGQVAVALPQENGDMVIHSSTQHPSEIQHKVAEVLGIPFHAVRVETRRMGGGFGGKESQGNALACACALAAHLLKCPCKMRYDRDDDMIITGKRHDFRIKYCVGFNNEGKIDALTMEHFVRCGWTQDLSLAVADRAMLHSDNAYHLPHVRITSHRLRTNMQSATAFRGFGGPQGVLAIERVIDHIAAHLGCDPLIIRQKNFYKNGDVTPYHMVIEDAIITPLVDQLVLSSHYYERRRDIEREHRENPDAVLVRGIALTPVKFGISFTLSHYNQAGALVHIYSDGSVYINHGGTEMGQGLFTKIAQVAAHAFDIPMGQVKISAADTGKVPNTSATAASSGCDLNGMAVLNACEILKKRLETLLKKHFNTDARAVFSRGDICLDEYKISFCEAVRLAYRARVSLSTTGFYKTPKIHWDRNAGKGRPFYYFAYGAAVTEVVVDCLTGENRILRADILHDVGQSLNPALDIGQIEGAYVQGAGWLTTEELVWDEQGALSTHAPSTYKIPTCFDRPAVFNVSLYKNKNVEPTIYRSKAVGEPPFMLGVSVFSALNHAASLARGSYAHLNTPATAERLLHAIERPLDEL